MDKVIKEFDKKREAIEVECVYCKEKFYKAKRFVKEGKDNFCNKEHYTLYQSRNKVEVRCSYCGESKQISRSKAKSCKTGYFFCNRDCQSKAQSTDSGVEYHSNYLNGAWVEYRRKAFTLGEPKCSICGYDEYKEGLEVHHLDKDRRNNDLDNLKVVCAICHRLLHFGVRIPVAPPFS